MFFEDTLSQSNCKGKKFIRRPDLDAQTRLHIAYKAMSRTWGVITSLAEEFGISRTFVYIMMNDLMEITKKVFGLVKTVWNESAKKKAIVWILCLRLEGRCSINCISQILRRFGILKYSSVGSISGILQFAGECLPNTLVNEQSSEVKLVIMACDEIFSHLLPILITVEPVSSVILRIELAESREVAVWQEHWECIERGGYLAVYLVNDEGTSMSAAQKQALSNVIRQSDTFHGLAHRLGAWVDRLEKAAYVAIEHEQEREARLQSAKSDAVIEKKTQEYEKARDEANRAIQCYDQFHYLYLCLISTLRVFDRDGNLNERNDAETTVYAALDLMGELNNRSIEKEVKTIRRLVPELFSYLDEAARIVEELESSSEISEEMLRAFCVAWQYQKSRVKAKQAERRNKYKSKEREELELLEDELGDRFNEVKEVIYFELDHIVQSSAMVENINSILRMHLNTTKNHVTQGMLTLFMHYHNHRRYIAGKRKGKTPMEILTGKTQQKDWLELLVEKVPWEQSDLLNPAA
ncbi:MAG: hypothetical protein ABIE92_01625 [bacterium]